jgi:hypothetical protein
LLQVKYNEWNWSPWATQIGSRANFFLKSHVEGQSIYIYRFSRLFYEISIFQRLLKGHTKELKRPHAARGPQVAHGWYWIYANFSFLIFNFQKYVIFIYLLKFCLKYFIRKFLGSLILIIYVRFSAALSLASPDFKSIVGRASGSRVGQILDSLALTFSSRRLVTW